MFLRSTLPVAGLATVLMLGAAPSALHAQELVETMPDGSYITLTGTIASAGEASILLEYAGGLVTVEMDDWDFYGEARGLMEGDEVIVRGRVDDDLYEIETIEASSVYVENLNTYFYASAADEEALGVSVHDAVPVPVIGVSYSGTVSGIDGREFTLDTGMRELTVDTIAMSYNPLDDTGYQQIDVGDYVHVTGDLDGGVIQERELTATTVTTVIGDEGAGSGS